MTIKVQTPAMNDVDIEKVFVADPKDATVEYFMYIERHGDTIRLSDVMEVWKLENGEWRIYEEYCGPLPEFQLSDVLEGRSIANKSITMTAKQAFFNKYGQPVDELAVNIAAGGEMAWIIGRTDRAGLWHGSGACEVAPDYTGPKFESRVVLAQTVDGEQYTEFEAHFKMIDEQSDPYGAEKLRELFLKPD